MTQQELQRQYQRNLSEAQMAEHQQARIALENSASFARSQHHNYNSHHQDMKQLPGIAHGHAPSIITSTANNDSFYHQRATTIHSTTDGKPATRQNYRWIDGRRHHNTEGAAYIMPNDIDEMDSNH
ncbi:hypothetical protein BGZ96_005944 [Linnemannia gamsii]|uniref:Uncharacterized protein n=1 Tax=Linnemannia gamsii TaxID=64522 RepID=A0ABQ7K4A0_9FUNG|nr:hypothetical protein BGZ96_005944 [Linnemannia gamsii]